MGGLRPNVLSLGKINRLVSWTDCTLVCHRDGSKPLKKAAVYARVSVTRTVRQHSRPVNSPPSNKNPRNRGFSTIPDLDGGGNPRPSKSTPFRYSGRIHLTDMSRGNVFMSFWYCIIFITKLYSFTHMQRRNLQMA